jgi:polyhydroxybutyrate depolymerase
VGAVHNLEAWAQLDRCRRIPLLTTPAPQIVTRTWSGCTAGSSVILHTVVGGGHTWPGSPVILSPALFGSTTESVRATRLMLAFFDAHPSGRA